ncbi:MAG TPA: CBS domain-containing protein [Polyangiaceae bacterium]|nr:CBS domain-containing protein [Polyangiaceae bacterium]
MNSMSRVNDVMHSPLQIVPADMQAVDALQFAERCGVHHLPLRDRDQIIGLVCTCDLEELDLKAPIRNAVKRELATIPSDSGLEEAARVMSREEVGSLLVTDHGSMIGIVTREDLADAGADVGAIPHFRCESCGAIRHLKRDGERGTLCLDCRTRAEPEVPGDGTGVGD